MQNTFVQGDEKLKKSLIPIAILFSGLLYIFLVDTNNISILLITKLIPMILIIFYASRQIHPTKSIVIGLALCTLGDALIIFSFLPGLVAFLIGHLFYIYSFIKKWHFNWNRIYILIPFAIFGVYIGSVLISSLTRNGEEAFILPVILYLIIISLMGFTAFQTRNKYLYFGSILFILSDTLLAWNKFIGELPFSGEMIMLTYYSAQFLIAQSLTVQTSGHKKAAVQK